MRPSVAHIVWQGGFAGMTRALFQLIRAQKQSSAYDPVLVVANGEGDYFADLRNDGVAVHNLELSSDRQLYRAASVAAVLRPYRIHHFHATETTLALGSLLVPGATRVFTHRTGIADHRGLRKLRYRVARWYVGNRFHGFSGNTRHACTCASELFNVPLDLWQVTYNGLEFSLHDACREPESVLRELDLLPKQDPIVGTAADLRDCKRVDLLLRASALVETPHTVLVIGDGPHRAELETLARELGIAQRVIFTGVRKHVADYLQIMDVFVLPSTALESFGNAAVEAMYQRVPVVVMADSGGLLEHVQHGENGFVATSTEDLAGRLRDLLRDRLLRKRFGDSARDFVTARYTVPRMVAAYDELYRTAEARSSRSR